MSQDKKTGDLVQVGYEGLPGLVRGTIFRYIKVDERFEEPIHALVEIQGDPDENEVQVRVLSVLEGHFQTGPQMGQLIQADGEDLYFYP